MFFATTVLTALCACGKPAPSPAFGDCGVSATADVDPSMPGPFHVGFRTLSVTYQPPAETGTRTIVVNIWYPTNDKTGTPAIYDNLTVWPDPESFTNASLAPPLSTCGYPTIEFSHGDQAWGGSSSYMMRHFASHGWVGIAPDHTGNLILATPSPRPSSLWFERSLDMMKSLDAVAALKAPDPLAGKVVTDHVLLVGHSFGSYDVWPLSGATYDTAEFGTSCPTDTRMCTADEVAVFAAGLRDPRVVAGIPEAGTLGRDWFGPTGETSIHIPIMQMTGSANDVGQYSTWPTLQLPGMTWIDIQGGCHETFNSAAIVGCATLDPSVGYEIVKTYQLAFARYHLLGDRSARVTGIVKGTIQVSPLVTFSSK
jgi:predicted dienelactone hydrolase